MRLIVTALALAVGGGRGDAAPQMWTEHPAESYCNAAYQYDGNRQRCLDDQLRAACRVHAHGIARSYVTKDGGLNRTRRLSDHMGMRAVLGLPPRQAVPLCQAETESLDLGDGAKPFGGTFDPAETDIFGPST